MANLNFKAIKITAWLCICFCILTLCYGLYAIFFRDYIDLLGKIGICVHCLLIGFVLIFLIGILRGINKSRQVIIPNNHRWLIGTAVGLFCLSYINGFIRMYIRHLNGYEWDWLQIILNPIMKPNHTTYIVGGLLLLIIAYLYKLGTQAAEEQRLTI